MYKTFCYCMVVLLLCVAKSVVGQDVSQNKKRYAVIIPSEIVSTPIASQSDSPLKIEKVTLIRYLDQWGGRLVQLRNVSSKPIDSYTIAHCLLDEGRSGGCEVLSERFESKNLLMPDQNYLQTEVNEENDFEIVPLTDAIRAKFNWQKNKMQAIVISMIVRVKFADGTVYSDEAAFKALREYCDN